MHPPRILLACLLALMPLLGACNTQSAPPRVVVFVTLDTLRSDHVGCYGYIRDTTPFLDEMAADGARFTRAVSTSSHTAPTHASMFTGLFPVQHRVLQNGHRLRPEFQPMAKILQDNGWSTGAFISVGFLQGLDMGFDTFETDDPMTSRAGPVIDRCLAWLRERSEGGSDRPIFVWVHLYDAHMPFHSAQTPWAEELRANLEETQDEFARYLMEELGTPWEFFVDEKLPEEEQKAAALRQMVQTNNGYDAEIRYADGELRRLHDSMEEMGLNEDALWVFVADHGEGLGNHDLLNHDFNLYQEQVHIPLVIHETSRELGPVVVDQLVRQVDLLPTVLDLVGMPYDRPEGALGRSLTPLMEGGEVPIPHAFSQRRLPAPGWPKEPVYTLQTERYKYIFRGDSTDEFYDLEADPLEQNNLIGSDSQALKRVRRTLLTLVDGWAEMNDLEPVMDADGHLDELSALGYMGD